MITRAACPGELRRPPPAALGEVATQAFVRRDASERRRERVGVVRIHEDGGVAHDLHDPGDAGGDDGDARAHRLERREAEALVQRGVHERGRARVERRERLGVGAVDDAHVLGVAVGASASGEHERQRGVRPLPVQAVRGEEEREVLAGLAVPHVEDVADLALAGPHGVGLLAGPVAGDDDALGGDPPAGAHVGRGGPRDRDDDVGAAGGPAVRTVRPRAEEGVEGLGQPLEGEVVDGDDLTETGKRAVRRERVMHDVRAGRTGPPRQLHRGPPGVHPRVDEAPGPAPGRGAARLVALLDDVDPEGAERLDQALDVDARAGMAAQRERRVDEDTHGQRPAQEAEGTRASYVPYPRAVPGPVVAIPVGPSVREYGRAGDLLDALRAHGSGVARIVLVDDDLDPARRPWPDDVDVLRNPRAGRGDPTRGGACAAVMVALAHAHACSPGSWVLRLDAAALPVAPFAGRIAAHWQAGDGLLGLPAGDEAHAARTLSRHARPVWAGAPARGVPPVRPAIGALRRLVAEAESRGHVPGTHPVGAVYAVSAALVAALAARRLLRRPGRWVRAALRDDELLAVASGACGLAIRALPRDLLALGDDGLPGTPADLVAGPAVIVHPVRDADQAREDQLRLTFAGSR